jgi:23S rRNA (cytidine2498-2'-O)-methyltransferase
MNALNGFLAYCRAGFEQETAEECSNALRGLGLAAQIQRADPQSGFVVLTLSGRPADAAREVLDAQRLVFARQGYWVQAECVELGPRDRVTGLVAGLSSLNIPGGKLADIWIEYPDTNDGKSLSTLSRALEPMVRNKLGELGLMNEKAAWRGMAFLSDKQHAWVGIARIATSTGWRLGIPRLRMPSGAPSRSTLKLAEAFHSFLGPREESFLQPEMRAVDLGAAPGGWTWQLIHRGIHVTAVDNGAMRGDLRDNALVRHIREDGFRYRPKRPVEWMVCDIVEQPSRVTTLVADWVASGACQHAIFNLKLPMKKRLQELEKSRAYIEERMQEADIRSVLLFRQLYHDREEVTGFLTRHGKRFKGER